MSDPKSVLETDQFLGPGVTKRDWRLVVGPKSEIRPRRGCAVAPSPPTPRRLLGVGLCDLAAS